MLKFTTFLFASDIIISLVSLSKNTINMAVYVQCECFSHVCQSLITSPLLAVAPVPQLRPHPGRRRPCLSAVWTAEPALRRAQRRAVHSWSGYGTLVESEEVHTFELRRSIVEEHHHQQELVVGPSTPVHEEEPGDETVADSAALLQPRARRLGTPLVSAHGPRQQHRNSTSSLFNTMPGLKNFVSRRRETSAAATSKPLVRKDSSSLVRLSSDPTGALQTASNGSLTGIRKCETVLALTGLGAVLRSASSTGSTLHVEPVQPVNRLRVSPGSLKGSSSRVCSRCSSLLSLASGSRYSLNTAGAGFVQVPNETPLLCKLCLSEVPVSDTFPIQHCSCSFCTECMKAYVEFEIAEGAYDISCPDAQCPTQGVLLMTEVERLVGPKLVEKHRKYRLNREVDLDANRTWCPRAGCETVCRLCPAERCSPQSVHCPTCTSDFCSNCKLGWHAGLTCEANAKKLAKEGKGEEPGIPFDSDLIKCCPMCNVPIEKDEGCAQMMCKRCKHVFCWYCLTSLDDDFLLRHYDKGPCKNKLGHSRASVIWHRTQVIGIFAGFGILLLVASPLLLLAAPCIVCCKCRVCNATPKLENEEDLHDESAS
ncbi:uncharacterized protein CBL_14654 [Carabus blaptoides fortunei]